MRKLIGVLFISLFLLLPVFTFAHAQQELIISTGSASEATQSSTPKQTEYFLPYPGLLPDNPLYFLKTTRDRIIGMLISDPLKKSEFDLLQADKRLNAGVYLINNSKENMQLAQETISKGTNYFESAITKMKEAEKQGLDTKSIRERLYSATVKHKQVLSELEKKAPQNMKQGFKDLQSRIDTYQKQLGTKKQSK